MNRIRISLLFLAASVAPELALLQADTVVVGGGIYEVNEGVNFELRHVSSSNYLFSWEDPDGTTFTDIPDPELHLTVGETYTFERYSTAHPFRITTDQLPVKVLATAGGRLLQRDTQDEAVIDAASLTPLADFTADPSTVNEVASGDPITLAVTESHVGTHYYTCTVVSHDFMTGAIVVEAPGGGTAALKKSLQNQVKKVRKALKKAKKKGQKAKVKSLKRKLKALLKRLRAL